MAAVMRHEGRRIIREESSRHAGCNQRVPSPSIIVPAPTPPFGRDGGFQRMHTAW